MGRGKLQTPAPVCGAPSPAAFNPLYPLGMMNNHLQLAELMEDGQELEPCKLGQESSSCSFPSPGAMKQGQEKELEEPLEPGQAKQDPGICSHTGRSPTRKLCMLARTIQQATPDRSGWGLFPGEAL